MFYLLVGIIAIIAGGLLGIIVNVTASRLPADEPLLGPPIRSADGRPDKSGFIPYLGVRHPETGAIDWPHLGTQLGAAAVVAVTLVLHGFTGSSLQTVILASILLTILRIDWQHHLIYLITIWPGVLLALLFSTLDSWGELVSSGVAGLAAAGVFLLLYLLAILIYKKRALGLGDVFLAGLIGTMVGLPLVVTTLLFGMVLGAFGGLFLIAIKVRSRTDYIPYGAYLSLAALVMVILIG